MSGDQAAPERRISAFPKIRARIIAGIGELRATHFGSALHVAGKFKEASNAYRISFAGAGHLAGWQPVPANQYEGDDYMFFLVSGAAASGKSTVAKNVSLRFENVVCHDCDERKVVDEYTRCQQLEEWIQLALIHQQEGQDFLFTSHSPVGELLACPSARKLAGISACLLDCSDPTRIQRMRQRGIDPRWPPAQDHLNWAAWHRMHAWDPQWEQHVITGNGPAEHSYDCWTNWKQSDERWRVEVIDTTHLDIEMMLERVAVWVKSERVKPARLTAEKHWWE